MQQINPLSDEEVQHLILSLGATRGDAGFHESEAMLVLRWARQARIDGTLLAMVLRGSFNIGVKDGEIIFEAKR